MSTGRNTNGLFALLIFLLFVNNSSAVQKQLLASLFLRGMAVVFRASTVPLASLLLSHFLHVPRGRLGIVMFCLHLINSKTSRFLYLSHK